MSLSVEQKERVINYLIGYVTPNKAAKIDRVLVNRTRHATVVLDDIYQPHNAAAVLRSAECFGIQDIHIVENENRFKPSSGVAMGASKWLNVFRHNQQGADNIAACITQLKDQDYQVVATTPGEHDFFLPDIPLDKKVALLFGTEETGLSKGALEQADMFVKIPMFGFTQSFNISVSVALCLQSIVSRLHSSDIPWRLSYEQMLEIKLNWLRAILPRSQLLERQFFASK